MTQEEVTLAIRFIAAGAMVPTLKRSPFASTPCLLTPGLADMPEGTQWRCRDGLRYEVAIAQGDLMLLPLLSDPSWWGWTLAEVERRGYRYSFKVWGEGKTFYESAVWKGNGAVNSVRFNSRSEHLVYMLEATK